jgi:signal transduction histidine kinase
LVSAANSDGVYSDKLRRLDITITPPFYKTWWFLSLVALFILGIVIYIVYLKFSKKLELQKVRLRLYENLHDDVGSRLTAILLSAEELIHQDNNVHPKLQHIAKVSKSIVNNMRRLVWAIDPENDTMNSMLQKIQYDKSLILDDKIEFNMVMDTQLKQMTVPGEIRYQVTSIVSEALNNISKYAQAKNVWIELTKKDNELNLIIRDNGVGFNIEQTSNDKVRSSGYGLGNMQKRVSRVKGSLQIHSKPGEGTLIEVSIPI